MKLHSVMIVAVSMFVAAPALADGELAKGDPANGEKVFKKCSTCHKVGEGAKNSVGPVLTDVVGRKTGTHEGFTYSVLNHAAGEAGLVWTPENIWAYLEDPNVFLKKFLTDKGQADKATGSTKMAFKLKDPVERADVVAYLKSLAPAAGAAPATPAPAAGAAPAAPAQ